MNSLKRIIVTSRYGTSRLAEGELRSVISIHDSGDNVPLCVQMEAGDLLSLHFGNTGSDGPAPMTDVHADAIANALMAMWPTPLLTIHCMAGVERSFSVAAAISDHFNLGRDCIDWRSGGGASPHIDPPNQHVYCTTMASLRRILPRKAA